jgi:hypothetical protein
VLQETRIAVKPDIVLERSIRDSVDTIREELKEFGDERRYGTSLRVIETQAKLVAGIARELICREEARKEREAA